MKSFFTKLKSFFYKSENLVKGEDLPTIGFKTTIPDKVSKPKHNAMRHGDRVRYFNNYNVELLNRISEIKSTNS